VAPSTPASDHSSVCSGGLANIMKKRAVSAPYSLDQRCGSTPLFFDFDIVPMPLVVDRLAVGEHVAPVMRPLSRRRRRRRVEVLDAALVGAARSRCGSAPCPA
jgi:hypothetical protein